MMLQFVKTEVVPHGIAPSDEDEALRIVELCGRTAYKSEEKITRDSARSFVLMLKKHEHLSVLEHSNIALKIFEDSRLQTASKGRSLQEWRETLVQALGERHAYHRVYPFHDHASIGFAIAGNFRAWFETLPFLKARSAEHYGVFSHYLHHFHPTLFQPCALPQTAYSFSVSLLDSQEQMDLLLKDVHSDLPLFIFKLICDRGITHEVVRHRVFSFTQESTRYVNYKNKGAVFILPEELYPFFDGEKGEFIQDDLLVRTWLDRTATIFKWYQEDLDRGLRPQIARDILPNLLKSEIFVSGRWSGWKHFIELRESPQAHPRIRFIAREVRKHFESMGLFVESAKGTA